MENLNTILTAGAVSALILEGIKYLVRKFIVKDGGYDFSPLFYTLGLALLNIFTPFLLVWLGFEVDSPALDMGWMELAKYAVAVTLGVMVSTGSYIVGIAPIKNYRQEQGQIELQGEAYYGK